MTFAEWWEQYGKDASPGERRFAENAWNAGVLAGAAARQQQDAEIADEQTAGCNCNFTDCQLTGQAIHTAPLATPTEGA